MKRTVLVIVGIQGLLLLAFSPVWYSAIAGGNQPIVDSREASSTDEGSVSVR